MGYTGVNDIIPANNAIDSDIDGLFITKQSSSYPSSGSKFGIRMGVLHTSGKCYIQVGNHTTNVNYAMLLNPKGGRVGIGTKEPDAALHVYTIDGNESIGSRYQINASGGSTASGGSSDLSMIVRGRTFHLQLCCM